MAKGPMCRLCGSRKEFDRDFHVATCNVTHLIPRRNRNFPKWTAESRGVRPTRALRPFLSWVRK